jgi:putative transposase/transposase-like zinc-binding protein
VPHPSSCVEEGATRPALLVADIVRAHGPSFQRTHVLTPDQGRALHAIAACRTAALGGHLDLCPACGYRRPSYNSCRNRHCPSCQGKASAAWVEARMQRVLPTPYFHLVFTLPEQLRLLVHRNRRRLFDLLFQAASQTLLTLAADPKHLGAAIGLTAVLHTWARDLSFHPHLHCVVTGGGLATDAERWIASRHSRFLFPVRVMSALLRGKFLAGLVRLYQRGELDLGGALESLRDPEVFQLLKDSLYRMRWVVYAKQPFGGPKQVFSYLGLYTHRVGISNRRILAVDSETVRFRTRGEKTVTLAHGEFLRRLVLHVLPKGFVKIRHYGLLAPRHADTKLETARLVLGETVRSTNTPPTTTSAAPSQCDEAQTVFDSQWCPLCAQAPLLRLLIPAQRPPPAQATP